MNSLTRAYFRISVKSLDTDLGREVHDPQSDPAPSHTPAVLGELAYVQHSKILVLRVLKPASYYRFSP